MMISFFDRKLFFGAAAPSPSASGVSALASVFFAFAIRVCPSAQPSGATPYLLATEARLRMVNDCLRTGKKLPGHKHIAPVSAGSECTAFSLKWLINRNFQVWHGGCKARCAGEPWERKAAQQEATFRLGGRTCAAMGSMTDGERSSRRTVAPDRAVARTRRGRQQHRQHQHNRLQVRQHGVPRIPDAWRARERRRRSA